MSGIPAASSSSIHVVVLSGASLGQSGPAGAAAPPALLPGAEPPSGNGLNDAMCALYEVLTGQRQQDAQVGETRVTMAHDRREKAIANRLDALKQQMANEASSGDGFFSSIGHFFEDATKDALEGRINLVLSDAAKDAEAAWNSPAFWANLEQGALAVGKVALAVGSVAATVATAGAASPLLVASAIALSVGGMVISQTGCLDGALGQGTSQWLGIAMEVGGAALSMGAGLGATGASCGGQALSVVASTATVTGGGMEVIGGAAQIRNGSFAANSERAAADATQAAQRAARLDRLVQSLIETIQQGDQSHQRSQASLSSAITTNAQTVVTAAAFTVRG